MNTSSWAWRRMDGAIYRDLILERLVDLKPDGSFWLDMDYFNYCQGLTMTNERFHRLFDGPPRPPSLPWSSGTWTWPPASRRSPRRPF